MTKDRFERNPLRILDCKADADQDFMQEAPKVADSLCDDCRAHFEGVQSCLKSVGVEYELDARLVRGLEPQPA